MTDNPMNSKQYLDWLDGAYAREKGSLSPEESRAAALFVEMERHEAGCVPCQITNVAFRAALEREDHLRAQEIAARFCPVMDKMATEFDTAMEQAFGKGGR